MTSLWTWFTQSTPVSATDVGWSDETNTIEISKIDTQVVSAYANDPTVIIIARRNRDTRDEFLLLDRRSGDIFSEWLGNALGAPIETAAVPTVGGPVSSGVVPVVSVESQQATPEYTRNVPASEPFPAFPYLMAMIAVFGIGWAYLNFDATKNERRR